MEKPATQQRRVWTPTSGLQGWAQTTQLAWAPQSLPLPLPAPQQVPGCPDVTVVLPRHMEEPSGWDHEYLVLS